MSGLAIQLSLRRLYGHHRVAQTPRPPALELLPECDEERCLLSGYASVPIVDLDRCKVAPFALAFDSDALPPLVLRHDPLRVVGEIADLSYDDRGRLKADCWVTDLEAMRMPSFSIGASVETYEMRHADRPDFYAEITRARISEIALTDTPGNPEALVMSRMPEPASSATYRAIQQKIADVRRTIAKIQEEESTCRL